MKKDVVIVAIPAYNEERNIKAVIGSIVSQIQKTFVLRQVIVICDGCTDKTVEIARTLSKKDRRIIVYERKKRLGKAQALNFIFDRFMGDYLVLSDADTLWSNPLSFELMLKEFHKNKTVTLVSPLNQCIIPETLMGKFAYVSYRSFQDATLQINRGDNFYTSMAAHMIKASLVHSFRYPKGTVADQLYLHAKAVEKGDRAFKLAKAASILFRPVDTFKDWQILGVRSVTGDRESLHSLFDEKTIRHYRMPKVLFAKSIFKWFLKQPVWTVGSVVMNLYIRFFPLKRSVVKNGIWQTTVSAKKQITSSSRPQ